jgi:hypothetical protein
LAIIISYVSDVHVFFGFLQPGLKINYRLKPSRGAYLYLLEGGPVLLNGQSLQALAAALVEDETMFEVKGDDKVSVYACRFH